MCLTPLFTGALTDAMQYPNAFESTIPAYHELPAIPDNICEGVVIKPNVSKHLGNGERVIIKNKNIIAKIIYRKGSRTWNEVQFDSGLPKKGGSYSGSVMINPTSGMVLYNEGFTNPV